MLFLFFSLYIPPGFGISRFLEVDRSISHFRRTNVSCRSSETFRAFPIVLVSTKVSIYQRGTIYDFTVIAYKSSTNLTLPDKITTLTTNKMIDSSPTSFFSSSNIFFLFPATQRRGNKKRITGFHDPPIK